MPEYNSTIHNNLIKTMLVYTVQVYLIYLMWTFIVLNLHQLIDLKAELNNMMNHCKSNNMAGSHQRRHGVTGGQIGFCKHVSSEHFPEGGSRYCTVYIFRKAISNLRSIKVKTMAKPFS